MIALAALLSLPACSLMPGAGAVVGGMGKQLAGLEAATTVTVIVSEPNAKGYAAVNEFTLARWGCTYASTEQARIDSMLALLRQAHIKVPPRSHDEPEAREAVFFTLANGTKHKFLFAGADPDAPTAGTVDGSVVTAAPTLPKAIYGWLAPVSHGSQCDGFIQKYK
jgi:hypothetical protein